ncbi:MAG: hypothetical protein ACJ788_10300, partial [Ktedonobacteraceae bacterium]
MGFFAKWCQSQQVTLNQVNTRQVDLFLDHIKATHKPRHSHKREMSTYTL